MILCKMSLTAMIGRYWIMIFFYFILRLCTIYINEYLNKLFSSDKKALILKFYGSFSSFVSGGCMAFIVCSISSSFADILVKFVSRRY